MRHRPLIALAGALALLGVVRTASADATDPAPGSDFARYLREAAIVASGMSDHAFSNNRRVQQFQHDALGQRDDLLALLVDGLGPAGQADQRRRDVSLIEATAPYPQLPSFARHGSMRALPVDGNDAR